MISFKKLGLILLIAFTFVISFTLEIMAFEPINHVTTSRAVQGKDGGFYPQDMLIGFEKGTASFHTITQVLLDQGNHSFSISILGPSGSVISSKQLPVVNAQHDNWAETLWVKWSGIKFNQSGKHTFVIYLNNRAVAKYYFIVS